MNKEDEKLEHLPMNKARRSTAYAIVVVTIVILSMVIGCYTVYANHSTLSSLKSELSKKDQIIKKQDHLIQKKDAIISDTQDQVEQKQKEVEEKARQIEEKMKKIQDLQEKIALKQKEAERLKVQTLAMHVQPETKEVSIGTSFQDGWKATYYSLNVESTGKRPGDKGYGITRSGRHVQDGITVAVDPKVIPLGTWIEIQFPDGHIEKRRADDTGGAVKGKHIDVYLAETSESKLSRLGVQHIKVRILGKGEVL